tara:strand:+ start:1300 stop:2370 length:1071 start_codon:yes stop_codon:yes gene_type:complete
MNTHPAYDWQILRTSSEVPDSVWQPIVQTDVIVVTSCPTPQYPSRTPITTPEMMREFISSDDEATYGPIFAAPGMPYLLRSGHPGGYPLLMQGVQTDFGPSCCRKLDVKPHPEISNGYLVTIEVSNIGRQSMKGLPGQPYSGSPTIRIHVQNGLMMRPIFRLNTTFLPGAAEADLSSGTFLYSAWTGAGTEVGGDPIDMAGSAPSYPVDSLQIQLEVVRRWPFQKWDETWVDGALADGEVCLPAWNNKVGARNLNEQWGFAVGTLRLDAINVLPLHHEFKTYQYIFTYDEHKHAQQFAAVNPQGSIHLDPAALTSPRGSSALSVYWNQPFLKGYEYSAGDWSADEWAYLETFTCSH